jgi:thiamine-phosphate pyrophosphorylase
MHIMLITDGSFKEDPTLLEKLESACQAGIDAIQLREKKATPNELLFFAKKLRQITAKWGVSLFINERLDLALAVKADGIHLPESAPFLSTSLRVGRSVHSLEAALLAQKEGANYLLFGPVFPPLSKLSHASAQGLAKLEEVSKNVHIPVIAVGGVTAINTPLLLQSGARGIAAISALLHAPNLTDAIARFRACFPQKKHKIQGVYAVLSSLPIVRLAIQGGIDMIQFRHKGLYTKELLETVREIGLLCRNAHVPFIVNDRSDIALEVDADGVHLGESDLPISAARRILGPDKIIGGSASTLEQALAIEASGADYVSFGHIFPTTSKNKQYPPIGLDPIKKAKEKLNIPLIAIGGISEQNVDSVLAQGANGIAVISAISQSSDPLVATQRLKRFFL